MYLDEDDDHIVAIYFWPPVAQTRFPVYISSTALFETFRERAINASLVPLLEFRAWCDAEGVQHEYEGDFASISFANDEDRELFRRKWWAN